MAPKTNPETLDFSQEWSAEKLIAIGALALASFLVFIYFASP